MTGIIILRSFESTLRAMLKAGMNVARLNFSHGTHQQHRETIETFRKVRDELGIPAAVLLDTKGPEIRIGDFTDGGADLKEGDIIINDPYMVTEGQKVELYLPEDEDLYPDQE